MKKHDEGYALPFVLVVIAVLTLVALSISSIAMNNLNNQKTSIQRMQDKYVAQGWIEKFVSQIKRYEIKEDPTKEPSERFVIESAYIGPLDGVNVVVYDYKSEHEGVKTLYSAKVTVSAVAGTTEVVCTLLVTDDAEIRTVFADGTCLYKFWDATYSYESYTITNLDPVAGETEGGGLDAA